MLSRDERWRRWVERYARLQESAKTDEYDAWFIERYGPRIDEYEREIHEGLVTPALDEDKLDEMMRAILAGATRTFDGVRLLERGDIMEPLRKRG